VFIRTDQCIPDHVSLALASIKGASVVYKIIRQFNTLLIN
jgi:hypothetical protein